MKKLNMLKMVVVTLLFSMTLIGSMPVETSALSMPLRAVVNGDRLYFPDGQPFVDKQSRIQVPIRFIAEALGVQVSWDGKTKKALFHSGTTKVTLTIGKREYEVSDKKLKMDTVALLKDGRTYVPARYVAEAFGAAVKWEHVIRTVYVTMQGNTSTPVKPEEKEKGTTTYYDGIPFNNVRDIDEYERMSVDKTEEFVLKLANQLTFVKENGKYVIKCTYPKIPEAYEWSFGARVHFKKGGSKSYSDGTNIKENRIPNDGSFTKVVPISSSSEVEFFNIIMSVSLKKDLGGLLDKDTGAFNIVVEPGVSKSAIYIPQSGKYPQIEYKDFDFNKMFQW
ncbi:hypothetical protein PAECIP111893_05324 [Paenibacillus plantiphilus]|uniref:Copper amine oxidase-like N-terminal domain-containing protein n=1 Tax=Paenibacillus plantiphilus TaxID=2905650 RepID=A0ABN8H360_9BACL|nr:copper amine oxidase N-terminal domain-containing protein [Paenibacillus plantiphilus]CAH1226129.1 hypothetical protein PAECIP111893_05324 [Paenibacillus plantiphilus]